MHEYSCKLFAKTILNSNKSLFSHTELYESKFMTSEQERSQSTEKMKSDNKLLKRAVKILYNRLSQTRHQQQNMSTIVEQNNNL